MKKLKINKNKFATILLVYFSVLSLTSFLNPQNSGGIHSLNNLTQQADTSKMKLKILTFNAGLFELRVLGFTIIRPADYLNERLEAMPQEIIKTDADIVGLQEVYFKQHQDFFIDKLIGAYPFHCFQRAKSIKINSGLMIFSKHPISNVQYSPLRDKGPLDERIVAQKGVLSCQIEVSGVGNIHIINFHPTSGGFLHQQDAPQIITIRHNQINQAYELASKTQNVPTVILGDFNTGSEIAQENYSNLIEKQFTDSYLYFCQKNQITPEMTWDSQISLNKKGTHSESVSQRIDHIYVSPRLLEVLKITDSKVIFKEGIVNTPSEKVQLSDHYALISEFSKK